MCGTAKYTGGHTSPYMHEFDMESAVDRSFASFDDPCCFRFDSRTDDVLAMSSRVLMSKWCLYCAASSLYTSMFGSNSQALKSVN